MYVYMYVYMCIYMYICMYIYISLRLFSSKELNTVKMKSQLFRTVHGIDNNCVKQYNMAQNGDC